MTDTTITDVRYTAEDIILDFDQWTDFVAPHTDDIYRILSEDGTAVDKYYSNGVTHIQFGHVYRYGGTNGIQLSMSATRVVDNGQFLVYYDNTAYAKLEIDCHKIVSIGAIPFDMSLFGSNPRLVQ